MTLPIEEKASLLATREFLVALLDPKKTPKVPKAVRTQAYWCLRHYPWSMKIERLYKGK
jgi:hypothetical protein